MQHYSGFTPKQLDEGLAKGTLPEPARTMGDHRRFPAPKSEKAGKTLGYVRVSSHDQKKDLATQKEALTEKAIAHGISVDEIIEDIGIGMNYKKKGFLKLMSLLLAGRISHLVIIHRDRLLRFGSELIFLICRVFGVRVTILEESPAKAPVEQLALDLAKKSSQSFPPNSTVCGPVITKNRKVLNFAQLQRTLFETPALSENGPYSVQL